MSTWNHNKPIDEHLFGDLNSFRSQYAGVGSSITDLRQRLSGFCKRTLRNQVTDARASAVELRTQCYIASKIGILTSEHMNQLVSELKKNLQNAHRPCPLHQGEN